MGYEECSIVEGFSVLQMHFRTLLKEHELFLSWNFYSQFSWVARKLPISTTSYLESAVDFGAANYKKYAIMTRTDIRIVCASECVS